MKRLFILLALAGCADDGTAADVASDAAVSMPDAPAVVADAGGAASDAGTCTDCEFFPATCSPDAFCPIDGVVNNDVQIAALSGAATASGIWAAGSQGTLLLRENAAWNPTAPGVTAPFTAISARTDAEVWAASALEIVYVRDATKWSAVALDPVTEPYLGTTEDIGSMYAPPASSNVWLALIGGGPFNDFLQMKRAHKRHIATPAHDVLTLETFDCISPCKAIRGLFGISSSELWAVGDFGAVLRVTNADAKKPIFTSYNSQTYGHLYSVWMSGSNDGWAVGSHGMLRHYEGMPTFVIDDFATNAALLAVHGTSATDVWAVGESATILHYDGRAWRRVSIGTLGVARPTLRAVFARSPSEVWVAGDGVLLQLGSTP